jgi:hypothetical protein
MTNPRPKHRGPMRHAYQRGEGSPILTRTLSMKKVGAVVANPLLFGTTEKGTLPKSATYLKIVEIGMRLAQRLNKVWHSMLPRTDLGNLLGGNTSVAYGAGFDGKWYAVAIFSQPIIHALADKKTIELRRLAICHEAPKNTASRMMAIMRKLVKKKYPQMEKAISYLAIDVHDGTIYKAAGWKAVGKITEARPQRKFGDKNRATGPLQTKSRKQRWEINL